MNARALGLGTLASLSLLLAACGTTKLPETGSSAATIESRTPVPNAGAGANSAGTAQSQVANIDLSNKAAEGAAGTALMALPGQRIVYFDFDSFVIKDDFKPLLDNFARALSANKGKKMVVEGHTDERGGREYNLALGQKRAEAVAKSLALLGANDGQIESVSFGKERPAVPGSDEAAWAKNRRAELVYR